MVYSGWLHVSLCQPKGSLLSPGLSDDTIKKTTSFMLNWPIPWAIFSSQVIPYN